jgi:hypothetical protein
LSNGGKLKSNSAQNKQKYIKNRPFKFTPLVSSGVFYCLAFFSQSPYFRGFHYLITKKTYMKKLKKTRAKLHPDEKIIGRGVPLSMLNEKKLKQLGKLKKKR